MNHDLIYYFPWYKFEKEQMPYLIREWLDRGVSRFVFTDTLAGNCLKDPEWIKYLHRLERDFHVQFLSMHSLCGKEYDLNIMEQERRPGMIADHARCMEIAAEFGCKTYTIHVGAWHYVNQLAQLPELRKLAADSLEKLVPFAEKNGITIAVENSFEPTNAAREVLALIKPYIGNPAVGVCFDTGHAHIVKDEPGKQSSLYRSYMQESWYEKGVIPENDGLEILYPHIVTTHMHDNDGYGDLHSMPGDGTIDWADLVPKLKNCPRMVEMQTEVALYAWGVNWAGELAAPMGGYSIQNVVETFRRLGF